MYQGLPDFQFFIHLDQQKLVPAYLQKQVYFLYPEETVVIQEQPALAFLLTVFQNVSEQIVHGKLNFTTQFNFSSIDHIPTFRITYPGASINPIAIQPFKLSFHAPFAEPSSLTSRPYDSNWYSTADTNFLIPLAEDAAILLYQTIIDNIIGFRARLDGFLEGLAPRYNYQLKINPKETIEKLEVGLKSPEGIYDYQQLLLFLDQHFSEFLNDIQPPVIASEKKGVTQAFLDQLFYHYGQLYPGSATTNITFIKLLKPEQPGRLIIDFSQPIITRRPVAFILDPFQAAQQIAKNDPDKVVARLKTPAIPEQELLIKVNYFLPEGLGESIDIDLTVIIPKGTLYPTEQRKTRRLIPEKNLIEYKFINNQFSISNNYQYQLRINYSQNGRAKSMEGPITPLNSTFLTLIEGNYPCSFINISLGTALANEASLLGVFHTAKFEVPFTLNADQLCFSYPIIEEESYISIKAISLSDKREVSLPTLLRQSTTIIGPNFPTYGAKEATINASLPPGTMLQKVFFQPEGSTQVTEHDFTTIHSEYIYKWFAPTIFDTRYRYQIEGKEWSSYFNSNTTITIK